LWWRSVRTSPSRTDFCESNCKNHSL
jgi:hypothetical protein